MVMEMDLAPTTRLGDYETFYHLTGAVRDLRVEASIIIPSLRQRTVWMINSADKGGGVAEMLPRMANTLTELGLPTRWVVIGSDRPEFFALTKRIHNLIHGVGDPHFTNEERELYEAVNRENAAQLKAKVKPDDIVVVHDPQPAAVGAFLKRELGVRTVWRCHIGLDRNVEATRAAWRFLRPYVETYDLAVFSAPEYIPDYLAGRSTIIHPGLDPISHKNRPLPPHKLAGVLCNSGLMTERHPVVTPRFDRTARRLRPDGSFAEANGDNEIGLMFRPIVTQISRWDALKGFAPLLEGFVKLKTGLRTGLYGRPNGTSSRHHHRLEMLRLVLAGPDPTSVQDDPEAVEVLEGLKRRYAELDPSLQSDIALVVLPMESRKDNALMVNALQCCSSLVVQNSIQEGFGLTATEAMWKDIPIVGSRAHGLRQQIRNGIDGTLIQDPNDPDEIAERLDDIILMKGKRNRMAQSAQQRVRHEFLIFTQLGQWMQALSRAITLPRRHEEEAEED